MKTPLNFNCTTPGSSTFNRSPTRRRSCVTEAKRTWALTPTSRRSSTLKHLRIPGETCRESPIHRHRQSQPPCSRRTRTSLRRRASASASASLPGALSVSISRTALRRSLATRRPKRTRKSCASGRRVSLPSTIRARSDSAKPLSPASHGWYTLVERQQSPLGIERKLLGQYGQSSVPPSDPRSRRGRGRTTSF